MEHSADIERPAKRFKSSGSFGRALADPIYSPAQSHFSPPDDTLILPRPWSPAGSSVLHSSFACTDTTLDHSSSSGSSPGELHPLSLARPFTNGVLRDMDGYAPPVIPPGEYSPLRMHVSAAILSFRQEACTVRAHQVVLCMHRRLALASHITQAALQSIL